MFGAGALIVRDRPSAIRLLLSLRGSILPDIWKPLLFAVAIALAVTLSQGRVLDFELRLDAVPFSLIGMTLAIFLGFRNNVCYERYREGRALWGQVLIAGRNFARQSLTLIEAPGAEQSALHRRLLYLTVAFAHALRHELRGSDVAESLRPLLDAASLERVLAARSPAQSLLLELGGELSQCRRRGWLAPYPALALEGQLDALSTALAGCERIRNTPVPFAYTLLMHRTIFVYCLLLPFGLLEGVGLMTPVLAGVLAYTFFGLDAVGSQVEEPFGTRPHQLPLNALCRTLEIDLRQMLGERDLPEPLQPQRCVLD